MDKLNSRLDLTKENAGAWAGGHYSGAAETRQGKRISLDTRKAASEDAAAGHFLTMREANAQIPEDQQTRLERPGADKAPETKGRRQKARGRKTTVEAAAGGKQLASHPPGKQDGTRRGC